MLYLCALEEASSKKGFSKQLQEKYDLQSKPNCEPNQRSLLPLTEISER